jgi:hypothetical protein
MLPRVDVRKEFSACVAKMGGTVIDDLLMGRANNAKNADFLFSDDGVVAELKCLEVDWADELAAHAPKCTEDWIRRGKLKPISGTVNLPDLPPALVREIVKPFRDRVQRNILVEGNKQIKQTRKDVGRSTDKGLLIIVNDGNRALEPDMMAHLVMPLLNAGMYSALNTVIYMTVNEPIKAPAPFGQSQFWVPWSIKGKEAVSGDFLRRLADAWMAHLSLVTRGYVVELSGPQDGINDMRFVKRASKGRSPA